MPNEEHDLSIDDLDNTDDVKGGASRARIDKPGIGRDLPGGTCDHTPSTGTSLKPGLGGPRLPSGSKPR